MRRYLLGLLLALIFVSSTLGQGRVFNNVAALATQGANFSHQDVIYVKGHTAVGDAGAGNFYLDTSGSLGASAENGGTIIATNGPVNSYWRRILDTQQTITPYMFGAAGDGTTDDTAEIQAAADAAEVIASATFKPVLHFPPCTGHWLVTDTITIAPRIIVKMDSFINCDVDQNEAGMVVGEAGTTNSEISGSEFRVKRDTWSSWADEASIGLQLVNLESSHVFVAIGAGDGGFTIGLQCIGWTTGTQTSDSGFTGNQVRLGRIVNNKISVELTNRSDSTGGGIGFCNENLFFGGRLGRGSGVNGGSGNIGIRFGSQDGKNKSINNNIFIKPGIELNDAVSDPEDSLPVLVINGQENTIWKSRNEGNGPVFARVLPDPVVDNLHNDFSWTHDTAEIDDRSDRASSRATWQDQLYVNRPLRLAYDTGRMDRQAVDYDASDNLFIPNVHVLSSSNDTPNVALSTSGYNPWVSVAFTVDTSTEELIDTDHEKKVDDVVFLTTTGTLPNPLSTSTTYYVVGTPTADRFQLSTSKRGSPVNITTEESGATHTYHSRTQYMRVAGTRALMVWMDTTDCKQVVLAKDVEEDFGGRVAVNAYDSDGSILKNQDTFSADHTTETFTSNGHGLTDGEEIEVVEVGALPTGLAEDTIYVIDDATANTFTLDDRDGNNVLITANGTSDNEWHMLHRYVSMVPQGHYRTTFGGQFLTSNDSDSDTNLTFRDEVKKVQVGVTGGTALLRIRSFQLWVPEAVRRQRVWVDYDAGQYGRALATQAPDSGVYDQIGQTVWDHTPANSEPAGWVLSAGGANGGTWINLPEYGAVAP